MIKREADNSRVYEEWAPADLLGMPLFRGCYRCVSSLTFNGFRQVLKLKQMQESVEIPGLGGAST